MGEKSKLNLGKVLYLYSSSDIGKVYRDYGGKRKGRKMGKGPKGRRSKKDP